MRQRPVSFLGDRRSEATFASDRRSNSLDFIPLQIRQASARILGNSDLDNMAEVDWDMADTTSSLLQALFRRNAARCLRHFCLPDANAQPILPHT